MNRRTPPDIWLDKKRPTKEVLAELGLERRTAYMRYGPRGIGGGPLPGAKSRAPARKTKRRVCPCCGSPDALTLFDAAPPITFGPVSQTIFNAVRDAPDGISVSAIADIVYGCRSKGANNQHNTVNVLINKMNDKLRKVGLKIRKAQPGSWGAPFFLVEL